MMWNALNERAFRVLFEHAVDDGLGCPPGDFQSDNCRTPQLDTERVCFDCWRTYTSIQAQRDYGFLEDRVDRAIDMYVGACRHAADEQCKAISKEDTCCEEEKDND